LKKSCHDEEIAVTILTGSRNNKLSNAVVVGTGDFFSSGKDFSLEEMEKAWATPIFFSRPKIAVLLEGRANPRKKPCLSTDSSKP
jgi:hypothetical protein